MRHIKSKLIVGCFFFHFISWKNKWLKSICFYFRKTKNKIGEEIHHFGLIFCFYLFFFFKKRLEFYQKQIPKKSRLIVALKDATNVPKNIKLLFKRMHSDILFCSFFFFFILIELGQKKKEKRFQYYCLILNSHISFDFT